MPEHYWRKVDKNPLEAVAYYTTLPNVRKVAKVKRKPLDRVLAKNGAW
jgi:hypothetical protein